MKGFVLFIIFILIILLNNICCSAKKIDSNTDQQFIEENDYKDLPFFIEGLTFYNYPNVDGSTSTAPLTQLIFCKLFEYKYKWTPWGVDLDWGILPVALNEKHGYYEVVDFRGLIKFSQTHQSIIKLIDEKTDICLLARKMSHDEKKYADAAGVKIIETPIALDAFIFIINSENPVKSLSIKQIQDIYTGKITTWKEVGGNDASINPYVRNANSGSQELIESMVMKDLEIVKFTEGLSFLTMLGTLDAVSTDTNAISYTLYYYKEFMQRPENIKILEIEGIYPDKDSISKKTYPLVSEVYASIRSDLDKSSNTYKLYKLLQSNAGKEVISESGYVPFN